MAQAQAQRRMQADCRGRRSQSQSGKQGLGEVLRLLDFSLRARRKPRLSGRKIVISSGFSNLTVTASQESGWRTEQTATAVHMRWPVLQPTHKCKANYNAVLMGLLTEK